jgi:hypothetical protein
MNREQELRRGVEKKLGAKVPDNVWNYLKEKHFVDEALGGLGINDPASFLAKEVQLVPIPAGSISIPPTLTKNGRRLRRDRSLPTRNEMISYLLAAIAANNAEVQSYRDRFLASGLLMEAAAADWIEGAAGKHRYSYAIVVGLPQTVALELEGDPLEYRLPNTAMAEMKIEGFAPHLVLEYKKPSCNWVQRIPTGRDGELRELVKVSESLASEFGWQRAQATMFVLTGDVPGVSPSAIEVRSPPTPGLKYGAWRSRIVITVDPSLSPEEVAAIYKKSRAKLLKPRYRSLSERHMTIAGFAAAFGGVTPELMGKWNSKYPKWQYSRYSVFSKSARAATERLLGFSVLQPFSFRRYLADSFK